MFTKDKLIEAIREVPVSQTYEEYVEALADRLKEFVREIFEEVENAHEECIHIDPSNNIGYLLQTKFEHKLAELKKKYESEKDNGNI